MSEQPVEPQTPPPDDETEAPRTEMPIELDIVAAPGGPSDPDVLTVPVDYQPRKRPGVLELDMGDGAILYDDDGMLVHHLNPSASLIWQLCDGSGSAQELAHDIAEEYGLDPATIVGQVITVIAELDALGLVEDAGSDSPPA